MKFLALLALAFGFALNAVLVAVASWEVAKLGDHWATVGFLAFCGAAIAGACAYTALDMYREAVKHWPRLLYRVADYLPCRIIADEGASYLERYYLCTVLGWRFYLHRFVASDPDRGLHDHPWRWAVSVILSGWYWEHTRRGAHAVRWLNFLTGDSFHRVVLPEEREHFSGGSYLLNRVRCWTLFAHRAEDVKPWGFWVPGTLWPSPGVEAHWTEYTYQREGSQKQWWLTAPKGRNEPRRAAP